MSESTSTSTTDNLASQYALQVALQTMKERCIVLQRRLTAVEEENENLRTRLSKRSVGQTCDNGTAISTDIAELTMSVETLTRQKEHMSEQINMVSNENRKLWSRLSQVAKEQGKLNSASAENYYILPNDDEADTTTSPRSGGASQNLIRSKTFTQHSPNPNLRHKLISNQNSAGAKDSMEEVALDAYNEKKIANAEVTASETNLSDEEGVTDDESCDLEAKKCLDGLQVIQREALKQQEELQLALIMLQNKITEAPCPQCEQKSKKPEMADKSLETDESLSERKLEIGQIAYESTVPKLPEAMGASQNINIIQEKIKADALRRTCPMCGKTYSLMVSFEAFQQHVEEHFIDESLDSDKSLERNFEFISNVVGDF